MRLLREMQCRRCATGGMAIPPTAIITREIRGSFLGSSSTSIKVALVERTAVLILACHGRGRPRHRGFGCVADALACHCAREILHPAEAGFRMTSMCSVGFRCCGWDLASRARSPALNGQGQSPADRECPRHTGLAVRDLSGYDSRAIPGKPSKPASKVRICSMSMVVP